MEDDRPTPRAERLTVPPLDAMGVGELEAYIAALTAEIARAREALARRADSRGRAEAVFGPRPTPSD